MKETGQSTEVKRKARLWDAARELSSRDKDRRDRALDELPGVEGFLDSPLIAYILITRLNEPELEVRYHLVRLLGGLLNLDSSGPAFSDRVLETIHYELSNLGQQSLIDLLEVSSRYYSAEEAVSSILKLWSYAGKVLSGIVNDRKQTVQIRQQAVYFSGELGFLDSRSAVENLISRVEKARESSQKIRSRADEEALYPYAVAALAKLGS